MLDPEQHAPRAEDAEISDVVRQLYLDGRAYAEAEVALVKARGRAKARALKVPAVLLVGAVIIAISAVGLLLWTLAAALATVIGPLAAGLIVVVAALGAAGLMAMSAKSRLEKMP